MDNWARAVGTVDIVLIHRLHIQERALNEALGNRYQQFTANRARLSPYLW